MNVQEHLTKISSHSSKLLRQKFGRGPTSCQATICETYLVLYIRGFISPMEEVLLEHGDRSYIEYARAKIISQVITELRELVENTLNIDVEDNYHNWDFLNNSGIIIFVLKQKISVVVESEVNMTALKSEVTRVSALLEKVPDEVQVYAHSRTLYLIFRKGILVPVEKALLSKGYHDELLVAKNDLEKSYFHREGRFEEIFKRDIRDLFIDWNLKEDKSVMAFVLDNK
ncbi:Na-translocating system protein MpsC family protein [Halalkalibacterium ligniniphilum]|uniref:Na-translocating system protein MpsC family protein n=1 Tax=Halalkalibacterium ligniniphilum TaxID=1134413 RepID=UPI000554604C|nr:Na-translocating system protein MpsC family protein [Halalkalibacterium ligniniphilum]